jgi:hypothetical protein
MKIIKRKLVEEKYVTASIIYDIEDRIWDSTENSEFTKTPSITVEMAEQVSDLLRGLTTDEEEVEAINACIEIISPEVFDLLLTDDERPYINSIH